jgi:aerobic-type carbon monoxide dehydrogenase small subunit (CoxS/CutS family)
MKQVNYTINGKKYSIVVGAHDMLSHVIRNKIGLTGTKEGCSQGSCGACTILVNGEAVLGCITPALRNERARITTIEGLTNPDGMHQAARVVCTEGCYSMRILHTRHGTYCFGFCNQ